LKPITVRRSDPPADSSSVPSRVTHEVQIKSNPLKKRENQTKMHGSSFVYPSLFPSAAPPRSFSGRTERWSVTPPRSQPRSLRLPRGRGAGSSRPTPFFLLEGLENPILAQAEESSAKRELWSAASFQLPAPACTRRQEGWAGLSLAGTHPARSATAVQQGMLERQRVKRQPHAVHVSGSSGGIVNSP